MNRFLTITCTVVLATSGLIAVGCGDKTKSVTTTGANGQVTTTTVPDVKFAKTKFVLHAGLALGAVKRWIYNPWKAGAFKSGTDGRVKALAKAALAAAFAVKEIKSAQNAALSDEKLRGLGQKLSGLGDQAKALVPGLKSGNLDTAGLESLVGGFGGLSTAAGGLGAKFKELNAPIPGT